MNFEEEILKFESEDNNKYVYKVGSLPVIITAAHTMEQDKGNGVIKFGEPFTRGLALYISNNIDTHAYIKNKDTGIDSNSLIEDDFKHNLVKIIKAHDIKLVIDLHGAREDRDFDVEFGTLKNLSIDYNTIKSLEKHFNDVGIYNIKYNEPFSGGGITKYVYSNTDIDVIQIEINAKYRDIDNLDNVKLIGDALINFIKEFSNYN